MTTKFWGAITRKQFNAGPFTSRQEAIEACFQAYPKAKECMTGYGEQGAYFDIRWHRNEDYRP